MSMKGKGGAIIAAVVVTAIVMQAEHEAPGATARGLETMRTGIVTPAMQEATATAGAAVQAGRDGMSRAGIDPGAALSGRSSSSDLTGAVGNPDVAQLPSQTRGG